VAALEKGGANRRRLCDVLTAFGPPSEHHQLESESGAIRTLVYRGGRDEYVFRWDGKRWLLIEHSR